MARSRVLLVAGARPNFMKVAALYDALRRRALEEIIRGVALIAKRIPVVFPVHPRTRTRLPVRRSAE